MRGIKILRRRNILICAALKTYLLCFPKYGPLAASRRGQYTLIKLQIQMHSTLYIFSMHVQQGGYKIDGEDTKSELPCTKAK